MKKRRLLSCALSLSVALASVTSAVSALSFNDVENDTTVSWARASIEKMTEAGYIKRQLISRAMRTAPLSLTVRSRRWNACF